EAISENEITSPTYVESTSNSSDIFSDTEATLNDKKEFFGGSEEMMSYEKRQAFPTLQELVKREAEQSHKIEEEEKEKVKEKEKEEKQIEAEIAKKKETPLSKIIVRVQGFAQSRSSKYVPKFIPRKVWIWVTAIGVITVLAFIFTMPRFKQTGISIFMSDRNSIKEMVAESSQTKMIRGHERFIRSIAYSSDSKYLVTGSYDNTIKIWDATTGKELKTLLGHTDRVRSVKFSPNGKWIVSGSDDRTVRLWSVEGGLEAVVFEGHTDKVRAVAFHPAGKIIASGSSDNSIKLWSTETVAEIKTLSGHTSEVWTVDFGSSGRYLASGGEKKSSESGEIFLWDYKTSKIVRTLQLKYGTPIALEISPDGQVLAACTGNREKSKDGWMNGRIEIWELFTGKLIETLKAGRSITCTSLSFHKNGRLLASGDNQKSIRLWDIKRGSEVKEMKGHLNLISSIAFSPDGAQLVSGSTDRNNESGEIHMWGPFK
ncbi:MAG: WD40 repeat domain-containing protein, partial [Bacteroidetes bacterium]|nr:WD40 repeat domain-containing protein [Bacteroidota bacterium]